VKIRTTVIVKGLVQGVNFRFHTQQTAERLGVTGWVMNLPDGSVSGCFEGDEENVTALVDWCRRGPDWSRVDDIIVQREEWQGEFAGFRIIR
jgi:acylphosphatase